MKIAIYHNPYKGYEVKLASALLAGLPGDVELVRGKQMRDGFDLSCVIGIKSMRLTDELSAAGVPYLYFDKGYNRQWSVGRPRWWRVSINGQQPTRYIMGLGFPADRAQRQGWKPKPWRTRGDFILYAGMSGKSHYSHGIEEPTAFAKKLFADIRQRTNRTIIYRPKPSWDEAVAIDGSVFVEHAHHSIEKDLAGAHAMITYASAACFEAVMCGIPAIVLGDGVMAPICSRTIDEIEAPRMASRHEVMEIISNMAYCQWSLDEIRSGKMWPSVEKMLVAAARGGDGL